MQLYFNFAFILREITSFDLISIETNGLFAMDFLASVSNRRVSQRRIYTFLMCIYSVVHGHLACSVVQRDQPLARISMTRIPRVMRGYALPFH